jgi:hypothetical protein
MGRKILRTDCSASAAASRKNEDGQPTLPVP